MKTFTFIVTLFAAGSAVLAAPTMPQGNDKREMNFGGLTGPLGGAVGANPLGNSGQNAVANLFKLGDEILNIPGDVLRKMLAGDPAGAVSGLVQNIGKAASDVPKDAMSIVAPLAPAPAAGGKNPAPAAGGKN